MYKYVALSIVLLSSIAKNVCELIDIDRYMWHGTIPITLETIFLFRDGSEEELIYECSSGGGVG